MSLAIEEQAHDLIVKAVSQGVSDIHLMPKPDYYVLYYYEIGRASCRERV